MFLFGPHNISVEVNEKDLVISILQVRQKEVKRLSQTNTKYRIEWDLKQYLSHCVSGLSRKSLGKTSPP